jgi:hypothetical protein
MSMSDFPDKIKKGISHSLGQLKHIISEFLSILSTNSLKEILVLFSFKDAIVIKFIIFLYHNFDFANKTNLCVNLSSISD